MSEVEEQIVCRQCREVIPRDSGSCPHCGTSIRDRWKWIFVIVVGVVLAVSSFLGGPIWSFFALGLILTIIAAIVLYDQYQRLQQADERIQQEARSGTDDEGAETSGGTP